MSAAEAETGKPESDGDGKLSTRGAIVLAGYLVLVALVACYVLLSVFPSPAARTSAAALSGASSLVFGDITFRSTTYAIRSTDHGLVVLALAGGLLGSFMHASQSLAAYVGNKQACSSWVLWYVFRPPIGAVLGLLFYFFLRAGLVPSTSGQQSDGVSPYGVVAFGALAGWFSKRATDKLAEIFETLFRTAKDAEYKNPLKAVAKPKILSVAPSTLVLGDLKNSDLELVVTCEGLASSALVTLNGEALARSQQGDTLRCTVPKALADKLLAGQSLALIVTNPPPPAAPPETKGEASEAFSINVT